ncbi:recombinase family protein [Bradyrhizobium pachyrhizi]|uniref:Recombinase family protein n=1 Tax=Bradyrhizobium pachyrhizi TaxID=280333 RepID=A0A844SSK9_9BRAD|nr:recombinase family protein [Bradyrhizobium pachyrhizi]MVT66874.1 recombinase family protein [Bradyrhizobium pachyrhizi]
MTTVLYARVSTSDQTLDHQRTQAEAAGFTIDEVVADDGVSGITTRLAQRPQGRRLWDMLRKGDTLVVRWVDRLGRNYEDVSDTIREFMRRGVVIRTVINNMTFDGATKDPMQQAVRDALIGFMAALSQAQAEANKEAQTAGIAHAKANVLNYLGRKPSFTRQQLKAVHDMIEREEGTSTIATVTGLSRQAVLRIKADPAGAEQILARWEAAEEARRQA